MNEKEKTHPSAATPERAMENSQRSMISYPHSTAEDGQGQVKIADLLSHGKNNAVTLQYLVNMTGFDSRTVRRMIHLERKAGSMIVSDNVHGYFLPEDVEDLRRFSRSMNHRAAEILSIARKAENALADMEGQSMIEGF